MQDAGGRKFIFGVGLCLIATGLLLIGKAQFEAWAYFSTGIFFGYIGANVASYYTKK